MVPAIFLALFGLTASSPAQIDPEINKEVWKQKFGVLDAQMDGQAPYAGWLDQDADGDGVKNSAEFLAGTNPFQKLPADANFRPPVVTQNPSTLSLTFPTVAGKLYGAESSQTLMDAWSKGTLPGVTGDGTNKTLVVPKSAGKFFHITVTDQATQGDMVSDWAKQVLGYSMGAPIGSQSSFNHTSLAANLQTQNIVSLKAVDNAATQPADGSTAAGDFGVIRITRSGYILVGDITVPLTKSGTAAEGIDYAPLPASVTFPAGVNSLDVKITPLFNTARTGTATVFLTANAPENSAADGNYTLGSPPSAGITIYPANSPIGKGLTGNYSAGSSATYTNLLNFGGLTATYSYIKANSASGTATITYSGTPATPIVLGSQVKLQFTSNALNISPYNSPSTYTVIAPVTATSFAVPITGTVPNSSTGTPSVIIGAFSGPVTSLAPNIDFTWGYGNPNGNALINADNYSVRWDGYLAPASAVNYVFRLDADDKARVLIDTGSGFQQILENGWDTAATGGYKLSAPVSLAGPVAAGNRYPIRVEFVETTGSSKCKLQWQVNGGSFVDIPQANVFIDNSGTTNNWIGGYYNNSTFTLPVQNRQDSVSITGSGGDWLTGSPDPLVFHNNFTTRWTGQVLPQYSQTYYFATRANEGSKLWVNNQLIVDQWGSTSEKTGTINLQAGVLYDIRMESYEVSNTSEAHLYWYSDDQAKQVIPTNRLFPTTTGLTANAGDPPAGAPAITSPTDVTVILGSPFSMTLTGSNGGTFTASGLPAWLTLVNGVLSGTPPGPGIYQFTVTTTNAAGSASSVITIEVLATGSQLTRDLWTTGVSGPALSQVPWTASPDSSNTVSAAEDNTTYADNTGERLRGYFIAPTTGNYYFWIAASNAAELWISNNSEPVNKVLRAKVNGPTGTGSRIWDAQPNQKSQWLSLVAGKKYYIEALHNTGGSGSGNNLSIAWFLDPTGNTASPISNGGGLMPASVLSPWDNPPTTTIPGSLYVTNLQGVEGLDHITATGGAFLRVNGTAAVLQLNHTGLTSGAVSRRIYNSADQMVFDLDAQDRNYPNLKTSDGGYSWDMQPADVTALDTGKLRLQIATLNHPGGEVSGTFGKTAGSQTPPAVPIYQSWTDLHATSDAANSRFLTQATFGPSPADMSNVKTNGYRTWIENQFTLPSTRNVPYILSNLSNDPQNNYGSSLFFNSWWKNSVTAPDQFRQRAAFALSEILVVSDTGPLNNNGRTLADYYDTLLDYSFGNYRDILKQVTLSSAMGVYLDMRGNTAGNIQTGLHPNENYAREIMQLFSAGLYRVWPDGTLVLDSTGSAVPTYDQGVITGMARVFTGWTWGQKMVGGRLPTDFNPASNYLDPMVLVPTKHELGSKILLDNVVLPAATVITQGDTSTDASSAYTVQSTDPLLGPGNLVTTTITNKYDLNGVKDLESSLDSILNNSATGPYICRQLIQRLVTSHPKPEYVHRVVRAFNGEQNVDGIATGVRGDMKDVFRAILLDYEARSTTAAADVKFGKQREPLLRITGPARSFPAAPVANSSYRQLGLQTMLVTTPVPHRLQNSDTIQLANFIDAGSASGNLPTATSYTVNNSTPSYSLIGATGIATITAPGYQSGDVVTLQFTSGTLGTTAPYNTARNYTVVSSTTTDFTINIGVTTFVGTITGSTLTPNNFTVNNSPSTSTNYTSTGSSVVINGSGYIVNQQIYLKFSSGGLVKARLDGVYTIMASTGSNFTVALGSSPPNTSGTVLIPRLTGGYNVTTSGTTSAISFQTTGNHNLSTGDQVQLNFLVTNLGTPAQSIVYQVNAVTGPNSFTVITPSTITNGSQGSGGMVAYPLGATYWTRSGTVSLELSSWNVGTKTEADLAQTPLNSTTVFNFFYPDFQNPGTLAKAGMTTPEFQLTNDSNTMNLTNAINRTILSAGNPNGYTSYQSGGGAVTLDLGAYMTPALTTNAAIPGLVDTLGTLLTGGNLSTAGRTLIINYVANNTNFPYTTPTNTQMRDRVRAIVHLIVTSAEYAIQK